MSICRICNIHCTQPDIVLLNILLPIECDALFPGKIKLLLNILPIECEAPSPGKIKLSSILVISHNAIHSPTLCTT